jgi:hypothetical protein
MRLVLLFGLLFSVNAFANFPGSGYVGGELGYGLITSGGGTDINYGAVAGFAPTVNLSLGGFYDYIPRGTIQNAAGDQASGSLKIFGAEALYNLPFWQGGSFGARFGYGSSDTDFDGYSESHSGFFYGPKLSYQITVASATTVDFGLYYLLTSVTATNALVGAQACLRFWF